ncbi:MAG: DNA primase [Minwuia sp.]|nr:DNA primase [Minwuia sp.]
MIRPAMAFPKSFLDEIRNRINMVELVGRRVALKKRGRDHWGCCPFHGEKTASFKVSEDRDDYHCFGCGAHGSAFDFVMHVEGLSFPEAAERLAEAAGLEVPKLAPESREKADHVSRLAEANEAAAKWFQAQLRSSQGAEAREYLQQRGLGEKAVEEFRLGYAPDRNDGLKTALLDRGFTDQELVESGLLGQPDDGRGSYDRFRNRLMFPIGDRRNRVIAFGGRALGEVRAKYLNSPESPLFDKGRTLYNHAMAREAGRAAGTVIVVEGYMDVIALAEAGFRHTVAPLGTAVTEDQIDLLWQMTSEPVLCLDGDAAGLRAARRAAERALPKLKPGKSLQFALLAEGMDPDDLVRGSGGEALSGLLSSTTPMTAMLWQALLEGRDIDTPERRAALERDIDRMIFSIEDEIVQRHYRDDLKGRMRDLLRPAPRQNAGGQGGWKPNWNGKRQPAEDVSRLKASLAIPPFRSREEAIIGALLKWPSLVEQFEQQLDDLEMRSADLDACLMAIRDALYTAPGLDSEALARHLSRSGFEQVVTRMSAPSAARLDWASERNPPADAVQQHFDATLLRYRIEVLQTDYEEAASEARREVTAEAIERMAALRRALDRAKAEEPTGISGAGGGDPR